MSTGTAARPQARRPTRAMLVLFAVSLVLRLAVLAWVVPETPLLYDEIQHHRRAAAFSEVVVQTVLPGPAAEEELSAAYGGGQWPPLHPLILGTVLAAAGNSVTAARFFVVLLSALTTALVFRLTWALGSPGRGTRRAAWAAALLHLTSPTFVAYSHYLWAETTLGLLCVGVALLALRTPAARSGGRLALAATGTGAVVGLAVLTHAAAALLLAVVPLWLAFAVAGRRRKAVAAGFALVAALAVVAPWQATLIAHEGRFVPLATLGGFNLALGNNPWVPSGYGSSWGHEASKAKLRRALEERARQGGGDAADWAAEATPFAGEEIRRRPAAALGRGFERLLMLWSPDAFPLRHLAHATYPPPPLAVAALLGLAVVGAYLALLALVTLGLLGAPWRPTAGQLLVAAMVLALVVPPVLTVATSRHHLVPLLLLLPAAGRGVALLLGWRTARPRLAALLAVVVVWGLVATTLPRVAELYLQPSSHYAPLLRRSDALLGTRTLYSDRVALHATGAAGALTVTLASPGSTFADGRRSIRWDPAAAPRLELVVFTRDADAWRPVELTVGAPGDPAASRWRPVERASWRHWQPTGFDGVRYAWMGGGPSPTAWAPTTTYLTPVSLNDSSNSSKSR